MPKIKVPRSNPSLDMTPMVDLAFLLVTFFMLTATMRSPEPVIVDTPSSISDVILPKNTLLVTIDTSGRVFFNIEGKDVRINMLRRMMNHYPAVKFTDEQVNKFGAMQSFGCDFSQLPEFIDDDQNKRDAFNKVTKGIPHDTIQGGTQCQLFNWINFGRVEEYTFRMKLQDQGIPTTDLRVAIKADGKADYKQIDAVVKLFENQPSGGVQQFNLITSLEGDPNAAPSGKK